MQSKYSLDLIPRRWLEYEPPSLCHEPITTTLAALGIGEAAAAGTAAAATAAEVGTAAAAGTAAEVAAGVGSTAAIGGTGLYGTAAAASGLPSLGTIAAYGGPILSAGGTLLQAQAQGRAGEYQAALARAQAADQEAKGVQEGASAQQKAIQLSRQKDYVQSQYQARMASSGSEAAGADQTLADIAGQGQYNILTSILAGQQAGADRSRQAGIDLFSAKNISSSILPAQAGTVLAGLGTFLNSRAQRDYYKKIGEAPTAATL
jgi:hypothetical protein